MEQGGDGIARLHVVAAVIRRTDGQVLVSRRPEHVDQGGLWEFPGGKLHAGEARREALARELFEELGIVVERALPLLCIPHDYPARRVLLDVFVVDAFRGEPHGREGQCVRWVAPSALAGLAFPAANLPIVTAACLPRALVITPEPTADRDAFLCALDDCLRRGARLVQLRAPGLDETDYAALAVAALAVCRARGARLMLNAAPALGLALGADGVHLNAGRLREYRARPVPPATLLSAACHDETELAQARRIGVDFALVSPVLPTTSHPHAVALGWQRLAALLAPSTLPVYALGGLAPAALAAALQAGCIGIAGIGALWQGGTALDDASLTAGIDSEAL